MRLPLLIRSLSLSRELLTRPSHTPRIACKTEPVVLRLPAPDSLKPVDYEPELIEVDGLQFGGVATRR